MAKSINKVILIGRLGTDPELKYHSNGAPYCSFSLATDNSYKDDKGNLITKTEWHRLVAWRGLAEVIHKYLKKGRLIYCEGSIRYTESEKDGQKKWWTNIVLSDMKMLDNKPEGYGDADKTAVNDKPAVDDPIPEPEKESPDDLPF
jgi:single-strand DNA-binding protein